MSFKAYFLFSKNTPR